MAKTSHESPPPEARSSVRVGTAVEIILIDESGGTEGLRLEIVPDEYADFEHNLLGESTPLAKALMGQRTGAVVDYHAGDLRQVKIISIVRIGLPQGPQAAARRQEIFERARQEAERTAALNFASSFNSKWGDYDPAGIEGWISEPPQDDEASNR